MHTKSIIELNSKLTQGEVISILKTAGLKIVCRPRRKKP